MQKWIRVAGTVVEGHRVASRPSRDYPYAALEKQKPIFKARGLDLDYYFMGTLNISIHPYKFNLIKPEFTFRNVLWTDLHPAEDFSFSRCELGFQGQVYGGMVYYPHPETKIRHFQDPAIVEVMTVYIEGIAYGSRVELMLNPEEVQVS